MSSCIDTYLKVFFRYDEHVHGNENIRNMLMDALDTRLIKCTENGPRTGFELTKSGETFIKSKLKSSKYTLLEAMKRERLQRKNTSWK